MVYERYPRHQDQPDFGVGGTTWMSGGKIFVINCATAAPARVLFKHGIKTSYRLGELSPGGRRVAIVGVRAGRTFITAVDIATGRQRVFGQTPGVDFWGTNAVWLDDRQLIYAALPAGDQPLVTGFRRATGARYADAWEKTWSGAEPSFRALDSQAGAESGKDRPGRLVSADAVTGHLSTLADGLFADLRLSPNRRYLAALKLARAAQTTASPPEDWIQSHAKLWIFDLQSGRGFSVDDSLNVYHGLLQWSLDSQRLSFFAWNAIATMSTGVFRVLSMASREVVPLPHTGLDLASQAESGSFPVPIRPTWLGKNLVVSARHTKEGSAPRFSPKNFFRAGDPRALPPPNLFVLQQGVDPRPMTASNSAKLTPVAEVADGSLLALKNGEISRVFDDNRAENIASKPSEKVVAIHPGSDGTAFVFRTVDSDGRQRIYSLESDMGFQPALQLLLDKSDQVLAVAPHGLHALLLDRTGSKVYMKSRGSTGAAQARERVIATLNNHLADVEFQQYSVLRYKSSRNDQALQSCMLLPRGYRKDQRYPLIVEVYPSLRGQNCSSQRDLHDQLLSAEGYLYLFASSPGELQRPLNDLPPFEGMTRNVIDAVDAAIDQGYADPGRIGLFGFSQGAGAALWIAAKSNRFGATVAMSGAADLWSYYFQGQTAHQAFYSDQFPPLGATGRLEIDGGDFGLGVAAPDNPARYTNISPVALASDIQSALLLINSDMDAFPVTQFEEMLAAMYRRKKRARLITYWGEGHVISSPANLRHAWHEISSWYGQYVRDKPPIRQPN